MYLRFSNHPLAAFVRVTEATEEINFSLAGSPALQRDRPLAREKNLRLRRGFFWSYPGVGMKPVGVVETAQMAEFFCQIAVSSPRRRLSEPEADRAKSKISQRSLCLE